MIGAAGLFLICRHEQNVEKGNKPVRVNERLARQSRLLNNITNVRGDKGTPFSLTSPFHVPDRVAYRIKRGLKQQSGKFKDLL